MKTHWIERPHEQQPHWNAQKFWSKPYGAFNVPQDDLNANGRQQLQDTLYWPNLQEQSAQDCGETKSKAFYKYI